MSVVTCDCGRELSFAGVVVQQCPDCGRWVAAGASPGSLPASQVSHSQDAPRAAPLEAPVEVVCDPRRPFGPADLRELVRTARIGCVMDRAGGVFLLVAAVLFLASASIGALFLLPRTLPSPDSAAVALYAATLAAVLFWAYRQTAARNGEALAVVAAILWCLAIGTTAYLVFASGLARSTAADSATVVVGGLLLALAATAQWLCRQMRRYGQRAGWARTLERYAISSPSPAAAAQWRLLQAKDARGLPAIGLEQIGQLRDACRVWNWIRQGAALFLVIAVFFGLDLIVLWVAIVALPDAVPVNRAIDRAGVLLVATAVHVGFALAHGIAYVLTKRACLWVPVVMAIGYGWLMLQTFRFAADATRLPDIEASIVFGVVVDVFVVLGVAVVLSVRAALGCVAYPKIPAWCRKAIAEFDGRT